jgi:hypothetical protein
MDRAKQGGCCAREIGQEAVAGRLDVTTAVLVDLAMCDFIAQLAQSCKGQVG